MRSTRFRLVAFVLFAAGLAAALVFAPRQAAAQKPLPPGTTPPTGEKEAEEKLEKLTYPESKDANERFKGLMEYDNKPLATKGEAYKNLYKLAQLLLDAKSDYFYRYPDGPNRDLRVSVKDETTRIIGKQPKDGQDFYQLNYGPLADDLLKDAKQNGYEKPRLAEVAQRYFYTKAGTEAGLLLAAVNLEAGNFPEAAYMYRRLLARPDADKVLDHKALFRAAVAIRRAGDGKQTDEVAEVWGKLEKNFPREGLPIGRKAYDLAALKTELDRPVQNVFGGVGDEFVALKGGNNSRTAAMPAGIPFLGGLFTIPVMAQLDTDEQKAAKDEVMNMIAAAYRKQQENGRARAPALPGFFPVTAQNLIIFRGYDGVYAYYTRDFKDANGKEHRTGQLAWFTAALWGAGSILQSSSDPNAEALTGDRENLQAWWKNWQNQAMNGGMPSVLFENPLAGSLSHDGKRAYFVDDFNVPPPDNATQMMNGGGMMQQVSTAGKQGYNRLVAVDLETGMLSWSLGESAAGGKFDDDDRISTAAQLAEGAFFLGPPVTVNGKLYALLERDGAIKLACFDANKESVVQRPNPKPGRNKAASRQPELVWVQNLGRANTPIKQDPVRRFQGAFLAASDGVMVCPTNSGAVVAVDLNARSLLWAHTYATLDNGPNTGGGRPWGGRPIPTPQANPDQRWRAGGPMIAGGRVFSTAYDGEYLQCLDLRTGALLWQEKRRPDDLYMAGVSNDRVVVVGKNTMRAIKAVGEKKETKDKTGAEKPLAGWDSELKIATPIGHGVIGKDGMLYVSVIGDADKPNDTTPGVMAVNTLTGKVNGPVVPYRRKQVVASGTAGDPRLALGNLVFHDGLMYSQSATEVAVFQLNELKMKEVEAALAKNPNDPDGLFSRGELALEAGKLQPAIDDFKASEKNKPSDSLKDRIKEKLYIAYTEKIRAAADFAKVEDILPEYKTLCYFTLDEADPQFAAKKEEKTRRCGLYLNLLADGREKQGKLTDAFDAYREYAELGERNRLLPVPEDPSTQALPEVWAAGRIDAMMRKATDPAARKPLEDKVAKEWDAVKGANDLSRVRNFVKVFGPYFESGREAQYLLAKMLTATNDDGNRREAQNLLLALITQAEDDRDPKNAARATDALAGVLTDRGLTDDALGLYRRMAERYPDTPVRGDKTGADVLGELIADKRYLPSLESDRIASNMTRYKASGEGQNSGVQGQMSLTLAGGSNVLPFYTQNRVTLDYDQYGGNATVRVTDRKTETLKVAYPAIPFQYNGYNPNAQTQPNAGMNNQRIAQVSGHLLMVQVYDKVLCYDLTSGKKEALWSTSVTGGTTTNPQMEYVQYNSSSDLNGDMTVNTIITNNMTGQSRQEWAYRLGRSFVLQANYATVLTKDGIVTRDPRTNVVLWQRAGLAQNSLVFGDARTLFVVEPTATGFVSRAFRAVDGVALPNVPDFSKLAMTDGNRLHILGRNLLLWEKTEKARVLRLYDCLDGKDVWSKEYPADSAAFETLDPEIAGVVSAEGKIDILTTRTGKVLQAAAVDAKKVDEHLKEMKDGKAGRFNVVKPLLLADADRFYTFLNTDRKPPNNPNGGGNIPEQWGHSLIRARVVNGVAYAFDRGTGKRLWYMETEFINQRLIVERFEDLPCLVASNPLFVGDNTVAPQPGRGFNGMGTNRVVAVDKANGAVRVVTDLPQQGNGWLSGVRYDKGAWEFGGPNNGGQRIRIEPDKTPVALKPSGSTTTADPKGGPVPPPVAPTPK